MMEKVDSNYKASSIKGSATVCDDLHSKRPSIKALGYSRSSLPKSCPIKQVRAARTSRGPVALLSHGSGVALALKQCSTQQLRRCCPQGLYSLRNHFPNENYFPVIIPGNQWRLSNTWSGPDGKTILKFHIDIKIDRTRRLQG